MVNVVALWGFGCEYDMVWVYSLDAETLSVLLNEKWYQGHIPSVGDKIYSIPAEFVLDKKKIRVREF
jgi:hypothetical protein